MRSSSATNREFSLPGHPWGWLGQNSEFLRWRRALTSRLAMRRWLDVADERPMLGRVTTANATVREHPGTSGQTVDSLP
jgi:hypothetical protein